EGTYIINKDGSVSQTTGTSFSTPIISGALACLWQALPDLSAEELIDAVRKSSSQYHSPDSLIGYGIPNIYSIFCNISGVNDVYAQQEGIYATNGTLHIPHMEQQCSLSIYSTTGQVVHQQELATGQNTINIPHITKGIYIVTLTTKQQQIVRKIAIR
ncbi:MAG: S8 family peptidase, partial [Bacteroidaceae bacterium]|nr:S8 family peptidase [Bacteroidaceae bacterium]